MTSVKADLENRAKIASCAYVNVTTGRTRWRAWSSSFCAVLISRYSSEVMPKSGRTPSFTEKNSINSSATQKLGSEYSRKNRTADARSTGRPERVDRKSVV